MLHHVNDTLLLLFSAGIFFSNWWKWQSRLNTKLSFTIYMSKKCIHT